MEEPHSHRTPGPEPDAPQPRFQPRGAAGSGLGVAREPEHHREEVVGQGSGETAGGAPATAAGDSTSAERRHTGQGGDPSNTPPSIPTDDNKNLPFEGIASGGEDTLEASFYVRHQQFSTLNDLLDKAREAAEAGIRGPDELDFDGLKCLCLPSSATAGSGDKRVAYRWRLRSETGIVLLLMRREEPHRTLANAMVRIGAVPLMRFGTRACWRLACDWLEAIGAVAERNKLSRIDACADLPGWQVDVLDNPYRQGHFVSRGRISAEHAASENSSTYGYSRRRTGFSHGQGQVRLRAYDKLYEVRNDAIKKYLLSIRRWGGVPEAATRVETQLRREALKRFGVDSYEDWLAKRAAILAYLTNDWFRLTDGPVNPKHPERSVVLPAWWDVQLAFANWAGDNVETELTPIATNPACPLQLRRQFYGLAVSLAAREGWPIASNDDFVHESLSLLLETAEDRDVSEDVRRKRLELGLGAPR